MSKYLDHMFTPLEIVAVSSRARTSIWVSLRSCLSSVLPHVSPLGDLKENLWLFFFFLSSMTTFFLIYNHSRLLSGIEWSLKVPHLGRLFSFGEEIVFLHHSFQGYRICPLNHFWETALGTNSKETGKQQKSQYRFQTFGKKWFMPI